jgi:hypothetical protein
MSPVALKLTVAFCISPLLMEVKVYISSDLHLSRNTTTELEKAAR